MSAALELKLEASYLQKKKNSSSCWNHLMAARRKHAIHLMLSVSNYCMAAQESQLMVFNYSSTTIVFKEAVFCSQHFSSCHEVDSAAICSVSLRTHPVCKKGC